MEEKNNSVSLFSITSVRMTLIVIISHHFHEMHFEWSNNRAKT